MLAYNNTNLVTSCLEHCWQTRFREVIEEKSSNLPQNKKDKIAKALHSRPKRFQAKLKEFLQQKRDEQLLILEQSQEIKKKQDELKKVTETLEGMKNFIRETVEIYDLHWQKNSKVTVTSGNTQFS